MFSKRLWILILVLIGSKNLTVLGKAFPLPHTRKHLVSFSIRTFSEGGFLLVSLHPTPTSDNVESGKVSKQSTSKTVGTKMESSGLATRGDGNNHFNGAANAPLGCRHARARALP